MPRHLGTEERRIWRRITSLLNRAGILHASDEMKLARYCELSVLWAKTKKFLDENGVVFPVKKFVGEDEKGKPIYATLGVKEWPQVKRLIELNVALGRIESEFGMDPSSRARITLPSDTTQPHDESDFATKFLRANAS